MRPIITPLRIDAIQERIRSTVIGFGRFVLFLPVGKPKSCRSAGLPSGQSFPYGAVLQSVPTVRCGR